MFKKIALLGIAAVTAMGFLTNANADYYNHHHARVCKRVVYRKVCHGPRYRRRCYMERRVIRVC